MPKVAAKRTVVKQAPAPVSDEEEDEFSDYVDSDVDFTDSDENDDEPLDVPTAMEGVDGDDVEVDDDGEEDSGEDEESDDQEGEENDEEQEYEKEKAGFKPWFLDPEEGADSDKEIEIALKEGIVKPDAVKGLAPKQRPVINKIDEIQKKLAAVKVKLPWIETLDVTTESTLTKEIMHNDFEREMQFYKQAEKAAGLAIPRLLKMNVKVFRPTDYYAEMVKPDDHMQKIRKKLQEAQEVKERQATVRRMREERKFAKTVQRQVLLNRQKEKKQLMEAVKKHRKGMKHQLEQMLNNAKSFQLEEAEDEKQGDRGEGRERKKGDRRLGPKMSRTARDKKFGFGGQKKRSKQNDKKSFEDVFRTGPGAGKPKGSSRGGRGGRGRGRR